MCVLGEREYYIWREREREKMVSSWADEVEEANAMKNGEEQEKTTSDAATESNKSTHDATDAVVNQMESVAVDGSVNADADLDVDAADKVVLPSAELNPESEDAGAKISTEKVADLDGRNIYKSAKSFEELPLSKELLQGLYSEMGFERPSRIQAESLPLILTPPNVDLIAQAHNGSGKTTCFVLSMLSRVDVNVRAPQALCMCPTRELVVQNVQVCEKMGKFTGITVFHTASEAASNRRVAEIKDHIVIGTPGKVKNWSSKPPKPLKMAAMKLLVFDEADHMFESDGFRTDSVKLVQQMKKDSRAEGGVQVLLFSATFSDTVRTFAESMCPRSNRMFVEKEKLSLEVIKQHRVRVPSQDAKGDVLRKFIIPNVEKAGQMIVFVRTKVDARKLHAALMADGFLVTSIHGELLPEDRDRVINEFRSGATKLLVATDILARGFDQANVNFVCNYDPPVTRSGMPSYETYLHRIGRSARFGRKGIAFNFTCGAREAAIVDDISRHYNKEIKEIKYDDEEGFITALEDAGLA